MQLALKHLQNAVNRWPKDPLRPDCQLSEVLAKRLQAESFAPGTAGSSEAVKQQASLGQANALYGLLDNHYMTRVCVLK